MRIVGFMVVGHGEADRYLDRTLQCFKRLCDDALFVCNNADMKTKRLILESGFSFYEDNREWGNHQPYIKEELAVRLADFKPDWVLSLDADEELGAATSRETLENLTKQPAEAWYTYVIDLWDEGFNPNLSFWNIRFWKYKELDWEKKPLHCGLAPKWAYIRGRYAPILLIHHGLKQKAERQRRIQRYNRFDPDAKYKDRSYYDALASQQSAQPFNEKEWQSKIENEINTYYPRGIKELTHMMNKEKAYVYVRREDGVLLDIPKRHLDMTMKQHPDWEIVGDIVAPEPPQSPIQIPIVEEDVAPALKTAENECDTCGFVAKTKSGAKSHAKKHE